MKKIIFLLLLISFQNTFAQWVNTNSSNFSETACTGNNIFGVDAVNGVYLSTNNGNNWSLTPLNISGLIKISAEGTNIFAGTDQLENNRAIYRSTNSGQSWDRVLIISELYKVRAITINGNNIYASTGWKIYRSTNNGNNWNETTNSFFTYSIAVSPLNPNIIFAAAEVSGVYISTNGGANWTQTALGSINALSLKTIAQNIFAGTETGVYLSTNNGANWTQTPLNNRFVTSLCISGANIFAGTDEGVFLSKNNGANWMQKNEGLSGNIIEGSNLTASANSIFISNENASTYKRDLSEIISIHKISEIIPEEYQLSQNYPNPFNPSTKINFSLPNKSFVSLKIYNSLGKEISSLVNEVLSSGSYEYNFNAASLPSGAYFYKLDAGNYSETKLMVLLK